MLYINNKISKSNRDITFIITIQNKSGLVHVCHVLVFVCLYFCVCECLRQNNIHKTKHKNNIISKQYKYVRGPLRECRSIRSGASGLPYYCAPLVCVSDVIDSDSLAEWRHNKPKAKKPPVSCVLSFVRVCKSVFLVQNHSKPGNLAGVRYVSILSVPGIQFRPVTVSFKAFSGHRMMVYTLQVGLNILNNLIRDRGIDCHSIISGRVELLVEYTLRRLRSKIL